MLSLLVMGPIQISLVFLILFFTLVCLFVHNQKRYCSNKIKGPIPSIGTLNVILIFLSLFKKKDLSFVYYIFQAIIGYCSIFSQLNYKLAVGWYFYTPLVFAFHPQSVKAILNKSSLIKRSYVYRYLQPWIGISLFTSFGDKWKIKRKLLTPTFHFGILNDFIPTFNDQAEVMIERMKIHVNNPWNNMEKFVVECSLDIICETAMGVKMQIQNGSNHKYADAIDKMASLCFQRMFNPFYRKDWIFYFFPAQRKFNKCLKYILDFERKIILEKQKELSSQVKENPENALPNDKVSKKKAFLEMLLEIDKGDASLTIEEIQNEVTTFMFAGYDTTAITLNWALYLLGLHPDIQETAYEELNSIFPEGDCKKITSKDISEMKYLECIIKETLRIYPTVPFIGREITEELDIDGHNFTPGMNVFLIFYILNRNPEIFPNPEVFEPERFFPEKCAARDPFAYVPFSAGTRNCLGQKFAMLELKTILAKLLMNFKFTSLDPRDRVHILPAITLKPSSPLRIRYQLRNKQA